jgi:isopentenyl phosphate kinase
MPRPILLVKLGGSLITDKTRPGRAHREVIRRLAREIAAFARSSSRPALIVGHGSGSFGHVAAAAGGMSPAPVRRRAGAAAVAWTQRRAAELHALVVAALEDAGAAPFSLAPSSFMTGLGGRSPRVCADPLFLALDQGLVPVVYGDIVLDRARGATIASTEDVLRAIASEARARRRPVAGAVWMGRTKGVLASDGTTLSRLSARSAVRLAGQVNGAIGTDVTGGMSLRLRTAAALARRGITSIIVDGRRPGALAAWNSRSVPGATRVDAS